MVGYALLGSKNKPAWMEGLLTEKFFVGCGTHDTARKNEKNIYCLDCCKSICPHCLPAHLTHRLLQVRRYVYHDVIRLDDLAKLIDCSYVQSYTINSAKVVFLNQRPQSRPFKGSGNMCGTCERILQEPYFYCSLGCKVEHIVKQGKDLSRYLHKCETLPLSDFVFTQFEGLRTDNGDFEEGQMTPNSILDNPLSSGSSANGTVGCKTLASTATTDFVKMKRNGKAGQTSTPIPEAFASCSRRKSTPQRSPLY
ncbi:hypothetical protein SUGI_0814630 [Cryptomeria japonica]|uniref:protein RGF1 INDUCIBLE TRANSCRIPTION FACTOR 1 isoform X2 n=1 Tax=Cryptomeria japonica TaxID=3369 RepID=UPI0024147352|nr:protein RGF1 INDUCIBLE TRANSCRIPTION FACTOR 1 isoform X2 [Cryptomeria japonica]GLJ39841.1 hypothetical protein SUGI_0814630 [Cryptomeria japonica]